MIYEYDCPNCQYSFKVTKPLSRIDDTETCTECDTVAVRIISKSASFSRSAAADWGNAHYNPALGKTVRNNSEANKIAKSMGMTAMGDEPLEKVHKKFDTERQQKIDRSYDDVNDHGSIGKLV